MIPLTVRFIPNDGKTTAWPELDVKTKITPLPPEFVILDKGMVSGAPSVAIRLDHPDGSILIAQTSAKLFATVLRAIMSKYPELLD